MRLLIISLGLFLDSMMAVAQSNRQSDIVVTNSLTFQDKGIYRFQSFSEGTLVFRNGLISSQLFNYNIALDEMHFINRPGDTLALRDKDSVSFISLHGCRFYYDKGYLQSISSTNGVVLAFRQFLRSSPQYRKDTDFSKPSPKKGNTGFFTGNGQQYIFPDGIAITSFEQYYLGGETGPFIKANKAAFFHYWNAHEAKIKSFLKTHPTNFNKLEDLLQLLQYCSAFTADN